jgi:hypothetical protein
MLLANVRSCLAWDSPHDLITADISKDDCKGSV